MIKENNATPLSDGKSIKGAQTSGQGARVGRRRPAKPIVKTLTRLTKSAMI